MLGLPPQNDSPHSPQLRLTNHHQVVVWDARERRSLPVRRSPAGADGHTHPVFGMRVMGASAHNYRLVTVSSDGRMCVMMTVHDYI